MIYEVTQYRLRGVVLLGLTAELQSLGAAGPTGTRTPRAVFTALIFIRFLKRHGGGGLRVAAGSVRVWFTRVWLASRGFFLTSL